MNVRDEVPAGAGIDLNETVHKVSFEMSQHDCSLDNLHTRGGTTLETPKDSPRVPNVRHRPEQVELQDVRVRLVPILYVNAISANFVHTDAACLDLCSVQLVCVS